MPLFMRQMLTSPTFSTSANSSTSSAALVSRSHKTRRSVGFKPRTDAVTTAFRLMSGLPFIWTFAVATIRLSSIERCFVCLLPCWIGLHCIAGGFALNIACTFTHSGAQRRLQTFFFFFSIFLFRPQYFVCPYTKCFKHPDCKYCMYFWRHMPNRKFISLARSPRNNPPTNSREQLSIVWLHLPAQAIA